MVSTELMINASVLLSFQYCEKCRICKNGHPASCKTWTALNFGRLRADGSDTNATSDGKRIHGTFFGQSAFAKHALVVESSITKVPDDTDLVLMSPLGCAMQTGSGAVLNGQQLSDLVRLQLTSSAFTVLKPDKPQEASIVIFGAGAVGFAALFAAAAIKIKTIIMIDLLDNRLELAKTLGATHTIPGKASDILEQISKLTDGGADYSIDATGAAPCIKNAWEVGQA